MTTTIAQFGAFENQNVRWNGDVESPWWVGIDVCKVLELGNHRDALASLEADERDYVGIPDAIGRTRQTIVINEMRLYQLLFKSRTEKAKAFQHWVFHEVLPTIRTYGSYPPPTDEENAATDWEAAILTVMLRLAAEVEGEVELDDLRVVAALGYGWLQGEDVSDRAIAAALDLPEDEVARRLAQLQAWGAVDEQRWLRLPTDLMAELV